jgi:hypothetical protein
MSSEDPVRRLLRSRGCPDHVIAAGLEGLVAAWEQFVSAIGRGYSLGLHDYLNDLDGRQLIEEALGVAPVEISHEVRERLQRADARFRRHTIHAKRCLWGPGLEAQQVWTPEENWWYYRRPAHPGPDLAVDLGIRGR